VPPAQITWILAASAGRRFGPRQCGGG